MSPERKRIVWRCRRGTRELDRMLTYFLENHYDSAVPEYQAAFSELLNLPNPQLQSVLMGTAVDTDSLISETAAKLIQLIRENYSD